MNDRPGLTDDQRGKLMVSAARYAFRWSIYIGTFFLIYAWVLFPEMIRTALWWYPASFIGMFLWKRRWLLNN